MDIVTLGAALNGAKSQTESYVESHFVAGSNIIIENNLDGTQTISASGEVSSEDTVARAAIEAIKDGTTIDSFGDVETALADKVDKIDDKGLSANDFTDTLKTKLDGIASGAEVNVQSDWNQTTDTADDYIKNKPNLGTAAAAATTDFATAAQGTKADSAIQGIKVNSESISPDANKVVNITVPTTAADVSALPDTTKYAAALSLTINSSTYVVTGQLKDQNGDNLGTAQTIDLPLESVVVGGSYNSLTKKVVLTLQNGNTIEFSVADLVSGLQTELSASNKLNPAYINYDSTHRAVSDTEKSTWNGKQDTLNAAQLAAVNSGIDSAKVEQIETNKNNISTDEAALVELVDGGAKNLFQISDLVYQDALNGLTATFNADGSVTVTGTMTDTTKNAIIYISPSRNMDYRAFQGCVLSGGLSENERISLQNSVSPYNSIAISKGTGVEIFNTIPEKTQLYIYISKRSTAVNYTFKPMICTKAAWDISQTYQPYRPSYQEIFNWSKATDCLNDDETTNAYFDVQNSYVSVYTNTALQRVVINAHLVTSTAITAPLSPKPIALIPTTTQLPNIVVRSLTNNVMLSKNNSNRVIAFTATADIASGETLDVQLEYTYF